jgi:hypothetical protein
MNIRIGARVALAIGVAAAIALLSLARRRRDTDEAPELSEAFEASFRIDAAPIVVVRAERSLITVESTEGARVEVISPGAEDLSDAVEASRDDDGARLILEAQPRSALAVDSARAAVKVDLAHDRQTRSVDLSASRSALSLVLPPARGGSYDVHEARSSVVHPEPVADGIPFVVQAARASVAIRAA